MADPRFFDNRGPFSSATLCAHIGIPAPGTGREMVHDVAGLNEAGPPHLSFFDGHRARNEFARTKAGWCLVSEKAESFEASPHGPVLLRCAAVAHTFAKAAALFYPEHDVDIEAQASAIHPTARLGEGVVVASGVVIGANAEIGAHTRLGAGCVIGRGVTIGSHCQIGACAWVGFAHIGDAVRILPGVRIGTPGFGFASDKNGHTRLPQLGRVIIQDRVEIGGNSTIDRGALADTVIGEGTKLDNLVHVGHNTVIGRHCVIAGKVGMAGSARLGDFVFVGGMAGIGDHAVIGDGARIAAMAGVWGELAGGQDYGGMKARPAREWQREMLVLSKLAKDWKRPKDE